MGYDYGHFEFFASNPIPYLKGYSNIYITREREVIKSRRFSHIIINCKIAQFLLKKTEVTANVRCLASTPRQKSSQYEKKKKESEEINLGVETDIFRALGMNKVRKTSLDISYLCNRKHTQTHKHTDTYTHCLHA
jgi:hypothetical protein